MNINIQRYIRQGECERCGQCCLNEDCEYFEMGDNGLATCLIHDQERPSKCTLFPENPPIIFKKCGYYFLDTWENNRIIRGRNI